MLKPEGFPDSNWQELKEALEKSQLIEAIKIYREATGVGLKEAKDAVEALHKGRPVNSTVDQSKNLKDDDWLRIKECLAKSNTIEAIKIYREATGCDLKEAKDAIDEYFGKIKRNNPAFIQKKGCGSFLLLISLLPAILYWVL